MRHLMVASFAAMFNLYAALTAFPLYVFHLGGSLSEAGLWASIGIFSQVAFRFIFGPMTDAKGRRPPLLWGSAAFLVASMGYLLSDSVGAAGIVRIVQAVGPAAFLSASSALAIDVSPPGKRATGLGMLSTVKSLGAALGPPVALGVAVSHGFDAVFWIGTVVGVMGLVSVIALREPSRTPMGPEDRSTEPSPFARAAAPWRSALSPAPARLAVASLAVLTIAYGAVLTFVPLYGDALGVRHQGAYFTILAFVSIAGGLAAGVLSDRHGRIPVLVPFIGLYAVGVGLLVAFASPAVGALSAGFVGAGFLGSFVLLGSLMDDVVGRRHRGLVFALQENGVDIGMGLGALVFGTVVRTVGYGTGFLLLSGLSLAWAALIPHLARRL